ncbi:hypothetical protein GLOTRDRAFT_60653 [Gloeophyllum trabeum ATCC 11539]|uniref:choline-phosphate cytidylyltransferase n=1 Tax=Gloeophyllum trabeum (strain ATCC 11539 / FP-39264 / Madison 617) TaxID=670483 RepID=S7Q748_GLOTA|nr:uncharacterized protein GLOTRDRAFT_60653 [Gloeophyllum trabeum ATCC 11539]EPQ55851.1 hypothetical protein GLOTRDRAFT_60653 [Gloeophyllum trabeum ATCC 11539]
MDQTELHHKKLPSKRSFHKHRGPGLGLDSPAYDASEEDNDPLTDDSAHSASNGVSVTVSRAQPALSSSSTQRPTKSSRNGASLGVGNGIGASGQRRSQHHLAASLTLSDDGVESPTYDGDVESTTHTPTPHHSTLSDVDGEASIVTSHINNTLSPASSASTLSPVSASSPLPASSRSPSPDVSTPSASTDTQADPLSHPTLSSTTLLNLASAPISEPTPPAVSREAFDPAALTPADIQAFVKAAIDGTDGTGREYKINPPPEGRPIRVYADGVYDVFHFGHALQLRQAKLSFPSVHLLVGVCSDELVAQHKSRSVMTHAERLESVRHCRWVDQVVPSAPWVITPEFLEEYQIDYVAHDEEPYAYSSGTDVYEDVKRLGKFIPTRRTPGISTSALLERIVSGYRAGEWDKKLEKIGRGDLTAGKKEDSMSGSEDGKKGWEVVEHGES